MRVIYADVLVIINIYITYGLLSLTAAFCAIKKKSARLLASSVMSGLYSLIILIPGISDSLIALSKLIFSVLMLLVAFGPMSRKGFFKTYIIFFSVNLAFGGLMFALWLFAAPEGMYYNNSVVYFEIDTGTLLLLTVVCYIVLSVVDRFLKSRVPADTVYDCRIYVLGKSYLCHCFLDTGNSLQDCYTGSSVIIVDRDIFKEIIPDDPMKSELKIRLIPHSTVSGSSMLYGFTCERVEINSLSTGAVLKNITVALSREKIRRGHFDGILPWNIFENTTNEREKEYAFKT